MNHFGDATFAGAAFSDDETRRPVTCREQLDLRGQLAHGLG